MNIAVIHISDLHITNHKDDEGTLISESWLTTNFEDYCNEFSSFIDKKKKELDISKFLLIVSGDLSNTSDTGEYQQTESFLKRIIKRHEISEDDIIIVPGNHDVNWNKSRLAFSQNREDNIKNEIKPYTFHKEKYENFKVFYDKFFAKTKKEFNHEKAVLDFVLVEDYKLIFIGINSSFRCSHMDSVNKDVNGYINTENLESELTEINKLHKDYVKIIVFHHNAESNTSGNKIGIENWKTARDIFSKQDINTFIFGHEHTPGCFSVTHDMQFNYIATGSTGKKGIMNYFNLITFDNTVNLLKLKLKFCGLQEDGNKQHYKFGFWSELPDIDSQKEIVLREIKNEPIVSKGLFPDSNNKFKPKNKRKKKINQPLIIRDYSASLLQIVKENKLFKSGHFHWSDNAKAHNWLDTSKLLSKKEHLHLSKNSIINLIKEHNIDCDLILGLGLEGNILASKSAVYFDKPYTYLPYSYRYSDHDDYEKNIEIESRHETILIITDVLHNGSTLTDLVLNKEKEFFSSMKKIVVISLFYTGKGEYSIDLLNNEKEKRFEYYYVCDEIKVEGCPYGVDFRTKCKIYSHKLDFVYEFYNNDKK